MELVSFTNDFHVCATVNLALTSDAQDTEHERSVLLNWPTVTPFTFDQWSGRVPADLPQENLRRLGLPQQTFYGGRYFSWQPINSVKPSGVDLSHNMGVRVSQVKPSNLKQITPHVSDIQTFNNPGS